MTHHLTIENLSYTAWANNVRLSNGELELVATLDVGPRIIRFGRVGKPNVFGEFEEQLGHAGETKWMLRGGHRLWVAPENKPETYEPDNEPVGLDRLNDGIRLTQKTGVMTHLRKVMEIHMPEGRGDVIVDHRLVNEGSRTVECSAWGLSVMRKGGVAIVPLPAVIPHDESCRPNQNWSLWGYTDLTDPRFKIERGMLRIRQSGGAPFKIGLAQREGWTAYWVGGQLFMKWFAHSDAYRYPDGNVNFEVYTDERILELETLGPLVSLQPGDSVVHREVWRLHQDVPACDDAEDVARHILPLAADAAARALLAQ